MKKSTILLFFFSIMVFVLISCSEEEKTFSKLDDLDNAIIGAMTGSTGEHLSLTRFPDATTKSFDDIMDGIAALISGQIDAVITAYPTALNVVKRNNNLAIISEPVDYENTAIAVKKGNEELLNSVNKIIDKFKADGTFDDLKRRWLKKDLSPYETVEINLPKEGEVLRIGTSATREPFCFVDENRNVTGHDGEFALRIARELNRPIQFVDMKFSALIPALQSGKIDMIVAGMTATEERAKSVNFTTTYFQNSQVMIVRNSEIRHLEKPTSLQRTINDFKNKRIGVLLGSTHDTYALNNLKEATVFQYKTPPEIVLAVKTGKVDAAIYTTETLNEIFKKESSLEIIGDTLFAVPVAMGFNKKNNKLKNEFNKFLEEIKQNGVYNDMINRWIIEGRQEMPNVPNEKRNGVLTVGIVSDKGLPYAIVKDNRVIGLDIEFVERFAAYLGKELKLSDMEFGSLIIAAASNKIDMIASTLMITEERKKQVDFSEPYTKLGASLFALKQIQEVESKSFFEDTFIEDIAESFHSNIIQENRYLLILDGLQTTIIISILATIFGTILGGLICFMRMSKRSYLLIVSKVYISILRGTPVLVVLMIIFYVVFASVDIDPVFVAVIAFGLNFAAYVSEMFRTGIESIDKGQTEAGIAIGFTKVKTFIYIILPQAVRRILPVYKGEMISLVKMTSIVGYIAVQDLTKASDIIRSRTFDAFFPLIMVAVLYFLISWLLMLSLGYIERKSNPKLSRR
ncbi:MAG: ABC transporter substrate-binding protein/permease [Melioribacteraceae bacterium]|jgi:polar amino acid transport system substrate-binding protein|nr:ABC transporter substrate-binding protein/permease [Melioribacteraceae bacterium]